MLDGLLSLAFVLAPPAPESPTVPVVPPTKIERAIYHDCPCGECYCDPCLCGPPLPKPIDLPDPAKVEGGWVWVTNRGRHEWGVVNAVGYFEPRGQPAEVPAMPANPATVPTVQYQTLAYPSCSTGRCPNR